MRIARSILMCLLCLSSAVSIGSAWAQTYPNRPVRLIVPYPPGGGVDTAARLLAAGLADLLKQSFIVENRGGASGAIGTQYVATTKPDGYTLLFAPSGQVIAQYLSTVNYDLSKEFSPITELCQSPLVLAVHKSVPAHDVKSLIEYSKSSGKQVRWAIGSALDHVAAEMFNQRAGIDGLIVPYKGGGPALTAVISGEVDALLLPPVIVRQHVDSGTLKSIGVTSLEESPSMPGSPAIARSGLAGFEFATWFGVWGPKGMPVELVRQIQSAIGMTAREPKFAARLLELGFTTVVSTPEAFSAFVADEGRRYEAVIRIRGIKVQ